jgi:hypothetical protein
MLIISNPCLPEDPADLMVFDCWFPSCSIFVGLWKKHAAKLLFAIGFVPTLFHFSSAQGPVNDSVSMKRASAHASTNTFYTSWLASAIANNLQICRRARG